MEKKDHPLLFLVMVFFLLELFSEGDGSFVRAIHIAHTREHWGFIFLITSNRHAKR